MYPSRDRVAVSDVIFNLWNVGEEEQQPPAKWSLSFVAGKLIANGLSFAASNFMVNSLSCRC